ncbi:MAG TPA: hypothetical protein VN784_01130 [Candidatus Limnocylindrales bacterium]|nr:hypothetical protein [Candidatus Limnocylindrales bacterium]
MVHTIELLPNVAEKSRRLFSDENEYARFRESFVADVKPQQEEWSEARRKSEEEARQRLLR